MSKVALQHISTSMDGEVAVVEILAKELRFPHQAQEVGAELTLVAGQDWAKRLVINMKHIKYLSSTGFAILMKLVKQVKDGAERSSSRTWTRRFASALTSSGSTSLFPSDETEHEAIKAFAKE